MKFEIDNFEKYIFILNHLQLKWTFSKWSAGDGVTLYETLKW